MFSIHQLIKAHEHPYLFDDFSAEESILLLSLIMYIVQVLSTFVQIICNTKVDNLTLLFFFLPSLQFFMQYAKFLKCTMWSIFCMFGHCRGKGSFIEIACFYVETLLMNANEKTLTVFLLFGIGFYYLRRDVLFSPLYLFLN